MTVRQRDVLLLFTLSIILNGVVASIVAQPGYIDAYYYFNGGTFIAKGQWHEPYLWNYVAPPQSLPAPAFGYWQPLPSIIAALGIVTLPFLQPFDAAQVPFVILASLLPVLAYLIAERLGQRRHALVAGLLMVFSGYYTIYWSLPESFTPYAVSAGAALALAGWGCSELRWWRWALAGVCAALAHLTRADGLLLPLMLAAVAFIFRPQHPLKRRAADAATMLVAYTLTMLPWWLRNIAVFGSWQAPGGLNTLWAIHYNDLFNYPPDLTPQRYFAFGWQAILQTKWDALVLNFLRVVGELNLVFLLPFSVIGLWRRWREGMFLPAVLYGTALFAAMTFAFTWPGRQGGWSHSAGALMPFIVAAATLSIDDTVTWIGRRRHWKLDQARQVFGGAAVFFAIVVTWFALRGITQWNSRYADYLDIGRRLDALNIPSDAPVVISNPAGLYTLTGHGGIPYPSGDETMLLQAADAFDIQYLVIDQNAPLGIAHLHNGAPHLQRFTLIERSDSIVLYGINP